MTAPDSAPGVPELMRRVGEVAAQMTTLAARLDVDYARKDLVDLQMKSLARSLDDLRRDADAIAERQAADRRLLLTSFIAPVLVAILTAIIAAVLLGQGA